jgi:mRNA interferase MazF
MNGFLRQIPPHSMICDVFDTVVVPFPFSERHASKMRPALVISHKVFNSTHKHTVLAMITTKQTAEWKTDTLICDLASAGLHSSCIIRMKMFTLDNRLIIKRIGSLGAQDRKSVRGVVNSNLL